MTAICTYWKRDGADVSAIRKSFSTASKRYGRTPWRDWCNGSVLLGKCLFPLLPEDKFEDPLDLVHTSEGNTTRWIVSADVRLTERHSLAEQLGVTNPNLSDSTLVAQALEQWGEAAFSKIYGAFAIIAWDSKTQRLLLARDALGERPLYYHNNKNSFSAASMPQILLADPSLSQEVDVSQFHQYFRMSAFSPGRSGYVGINTLRPGYMLIVTHGHVEEILWWKPDLTPLQLGSQEGYEQALKATLEQAVSASLRRITTKIGTHLSGGFDSTAVATTAACLLKTNGQSITAFVAAPRDGQQHTISSNHFADESHIAALTAAMHENMSLLRIVPRDGPISRLTRAREIYPTPTGNLCNLPWFEQINETAQDMGICVVLEGSMGNTTLSESGVAALRDLVREKRFTTWFRISRKLVNNGWMRWRGVLFNSFEEFLPDWLWKQCNELFGKSVGNDRTTSLLTEEAFNNAEKAYYTAVSEQGLLTLGNDKYNRERGVSSVNFRMYVAQTSDISEMRKATLAEWGVDLRDPTSDRRLFELALRIPVERLVWEGEPRAILRRILVDRAPPEVLDNRQKGYQGADWAQAICQDREAFLSELERLELFEPTAELLDTKKIRSLIENMPENGSDDWNNNKAQDAYRFACLQTISAASHMRYIARSNL